MKPVYNVLPPPGYQIVGSPSRRKTEPGFFIQQIVPDLRQAEGEPWHGRLAKDLFTLHIEQIRSDTDPGRLPVQAAAPLRLEIGDWLILALPAPGTTKWTQICDHWSEPFGDTAKRTLKELSGPVALARITGLHPISMGSSRGWIWREDGTNGPE